MLANPVTLRCSELFDSRTHAVIGISPFNSYFSEMRISEPGGRAETLQPFTSMCLTDPLRSRSRR